MVTSCVIPALLAWRFVMVLALCICMQCDNERDGGRGREREREREREKPYKCGSDCEKMNVVCIHITKRWLCLTNCNNHCGV